MSAEGDRDLLVVVGPTASGKTALAIDLAEKLGGEIVGADSVQVYRRFDVGSGKPTAEERARIPHHLVDVADAREPIDAARFVELADEAIRDIRARGKKPIVCGGTFLWIKALVQGLAKAPPADPAIRARHASIVEARGRGALHEELARVDPDIAARLGPNDFVRVSRALEVFEASGKTMSAWQREHAFGDARYDAKFIGARRSREELDRRIEARTRAFVAAGFVEEVRALCADGLGDTRAMSSVGYRQVKEHLEGAISREDLELAIVRATRVFVRRQRTWIRDLDVEWVET